MTFVDSVGIPTISVCLGFDLLFVNALLLWRSVMFCCDCSIYVGLVLGYLLIQIISVVFGFCDLLVVCRLVWILFLFVVLVFAISLLVCMYLWLLLVRLSVVANLFACGLLV